MSNDPLDQVEGAINDILSSPPGGKWERPTVTLRETITPQEQPTASITEYLYNLDVKLTGLYSKLDELEAKLSDKLDTIHRVLR